MGIGAGLALGLSDMQIGSQQGQIAGQQQAYMRQLALQQYMLQQQRERDVEQGQRAQLYGQGYTLPDDTAGDTTQQPNTNLTLGSASGSGTGGASTGSVGTQVDNQGNPTAEDNLPAILRGAYSAGGPNGPSVQSPPLTNFGKDIANRSAAARGVAPSGGPNAGLQGSGLSGAPPLVPGLTDNPLGRFAASGGVDAAPATGPGSGGQFPMFGAADPTSGGVQKIGGGMTYNPNNPSTRAAGFGAVLKTTPTAMDLADLDLRRQGLVLEQRKQDLQTAYQNGMISLEAYKAQTERTTAGLMELFREDNMGREVGSSFVNRPDVKPIIMRSGTYAQLEPILGQATGETTPDGKPNPAARRQLLIAYSQLGSPNGRVNSFLVKSAFGDSGNPSIPGQVEAAIAKLTKGTIPDELINNMKQEIGAQKAGDASTYSKLYQGLQDQNPKMKFSTVPRPEDLYGAAPTAGAASALAAPKGAGYSSDNPFAPK